MPRCLLVLLLLLGAGSAQEPVTTKAGDRALRFDSTDDYYTLVIRTQYRGEPALKFRLRHWRNWQEPTWGWMYITAGQIAYEPEHDKNKDDAASIARSRTASFAVDRQNGCVIKLISEGAVFVKPYDFSVVFYSNDSNMLRVHCGDNATERQSAQRVMQWVESAFTDFQGTLARFDRLHAPKPAAPPPQPAAPARATLVVSSSPGGAQVYLDNRFQGTTSQGGELVVDAAPGSYDLRVSSAGYKDWNMWVHLKAGERQRITAVLSSTGPKPLTRPEIEEMLANKLPKARIVSLVKQYGVDFALDAQAEEELRAKGADSDLLLAIATNKK